MASAMCNHFCIRQVLACYTVAERYNNSNSEPLSQTAIGGHCIILPPTLHLFFFGGFYFALFPNRKHGKTHSLGLGLGRQRITLRRMLWGDHGVGRGLAHDVDEGRRPQNCRRLFRNYLFSILVYGSENGALQEVHRARPPLRGAVWP